MNGGNGLAQGAAEQQENEIAGSAPNWQGEHKVIVAEAPQAA
jgi:hypothetical protein